MRPNKNYTETAKANEKLFRLILDEFKIPHRELTIEEIYKKYSEGNRYGIWTILNFEEKDGMFEFSYENIATLSGRGGSKKYTMEGEELKYLGSGMRWMS